MRPSMNRFLPTSLASSLACTLPRQVSWTLSTGLCQISLPGDVPPCNLSRQTPSCPLRPISGIGWHHELNAHEFEPTLGDSEGQGGLACCSPWGHRVGHDWETEQLASNAPILGLFHFLQAGLAVPPLSFQGTCMDWVALCCDCLWFSHQPMLDSGQRLGFLHC